MSTNLAPLPGVTDESVLISPPVAQGLPRRQRQYVTAALMLVMVLASMEQTITSTVMPTIISALHGLSQYAMVTAIYLLSCTVSMPLYGRLADKMGRKPVVLGAITIFLVASLLAATSRTMGQLIAFRGLQGLGAGGIMPVVLTILSDIFTLKERAQVQGLFSGIWGVSSMAGPWLGAHLVTWLSWRAIFYVNLPFGILSMIVLAAKYRDVEKPHPTDLDLPGVALMALACGSLLALISPIRDTGWPTGWAIALGLTALATGVGFMLHEIRAEHPIMPPRLMLRREIWPSMLGGCLLGIAFMSVDTYVPLYVQAVYGGGPKAAATVVTSVMLAWALVNCVTATLLVRWGFRLLTVVGAVLIVAAFSGLVICSFYGSSRWVLTVVLAVAGLGFGPVSMSYLLAAQGAVEWQQRGIVTGTSQFCRTMGAAVGIQLMGMLFERIMNRGLQGVALASRYGAESLDFTNPVNQRLVAGSLKWVFVTMLAAAVVGVFVSLMMKAQDVGRISAVEALEASVA